MSGGYSCFGICFYGGPGRGPRVQIMKPSNRKPQLAPGTRNYKPGSETSSKLRWILKVLHDPKYTILWELWYYSILRSCRILVSTIVSIISGATPRTSTNPHGKACEAAWEVARRGAQRPFCTCIMVWGLCGVLLKSRLPCVPMHFLG